jgi:predicted enzyme related to lactoylglutathione lyase
MNRGACCAIAAVAFVAGAATGKTMQAPDAAPPAERVTGIGGVFIKAKDPAALARWYRENLGFDTRANRTIFEWREHDNPKSVALTVWALFADTTKYFSPGTAAFMVNYRVRDLDRMLAQLRAHGVTVEPRVMTDDAGRFAWVVDPEGNKLELWEPRRQR